MKVYSLDKLPQFVRADIPNLEAMPEKISDEEQRLVDNIKMHEAQIEAARALIKAKCKHPKSHVFGRMYYYTDTLGKDGKNEYHVVCTLCNKELLHLKD